MPGAAVIFDNSTRFSASFFLAQNDFIMEKAYVYAVICLGKWLGGKLFPPGVYGLWPPEAPSQIYERSPPVIVDVEDGDAGASSSAGRR